VVIPRSFGRLESERLHRPFVNVEAELTEVARWGHQVEGMPWERRLPKENNYRQSSVNVPVAAQCSNHCGDSPRQTERLECDASGLLTPQRYE
jgi:hypothetical protein